MRRKKKPNADLLADLVSADIHSEIYRLRPDVQAVVHSRSPSVVPYGVTGTQLQVVYRAIYAEVNARLQSEALRLGEITFLNEQEAARAQWQPTMPLSTGRGSYGRSGRPGSVDA